MTRYQLIKRAVKDTIEDVLFGLYILMVGFILFSIGAVIFMGIILIVYNLVENRAF